MVDSPVGSHYLEKQGKTLQVKETVTKKSMQHRVRLVLEGKSWETARVFMEGEREFINSKVQGSA
jgi:hypothetical protein